MNIKRYPIWFLMISKKLLKNKSFLISLLISMMIVPLFNLMAKDEGSVSKTSVYVDTSLTFGKEISDELLSQDSIIKYINCTSKDEAINMVKSGKCQSAIIFDTDFDQNLINYSQGKTTKPFIKIIQREESIYNMLSREKLYPKVFKYISYEHYKDFTKNNVLKDTSLSDNEIKKFFDKKEVKDKLIKVSMIGTNTHIDTEDKNILKTPLRGLLAIFMMLGILLSGALYLYEEKRGVYDFLSIEKRLGVKFLTLLSSGVIFSLGMSVSIFLGGISNSLLFEIISMILFMICSVAFCMALLSLIKNLTVYVTLVPFIMITTLILSPIFFSLAHFKPLRLMMSVYYYLMSVYNHEYIWYMALYSLFMFAFSYFVSKVRR